MTTLRALLGLVVFAGFLWLVITEHPWFAGATGLMVYALWTGRDKP